MKKRGKNTYKKRRQHIRAFSFMRFILYFLIIAIVAAFTLLSLLTGTVLVEGMGVIVAEKTTFVRSLTTARLVSVNKLEGEYVSQGDIIMVMESKKLEIEAFSLQKGLNDAVMNLYFHYDNYRKDKNEFYTYCAGLGIDLTQYPGRMFINDTPFQLAMQQKKIEQARLVFSKSKINYDEAIMLKRKGLDQYNKNEFQEKKFQKDFSEVDLKLQEDIYYEHLRNAQSFPSIAQQVLAQKKQADYIQFLLDHLHVRAPASGILTRQPFRKHNIGIVIKEEDTICAISSRDSMEVDGIIDEKDFFYVTPGKQAKVQIAALPHQKFRVFPGAVREVSASAEKGKFHVIISLGTNSIFLDGKLRYLVPGLTTRFQIITHKASLIEIIYKKTFGP